jgi:uncharacterized protein YbaR (Trm112 family)
MLKCPFCYGPVDVRMRRALEVFACPNGCQHELQLDTDRRAQPILCCSPDEWASIEDAAHAEDPHAWVEDSEWGEK